MTGAFRISAFVVMALGLFGCQQTTHQVMDSYKILQNGLPDAATVYLACQAKQGCEFERIDKIAIIDEDSKRPSNEAIEQGLVRLEGSVFSWQHEYAVSLPVGNHEIAVRFYPVSVERAERFHLIHNFEPNHQYQLNMYRQREKKDQSLLAVAAPSKLCVDLLQDQIPLRRFCRSFDAIGLGDFVEQSI